MNKFSDSIGRTFSRLTLVAFAERRGKSNYGLFLCSCGEEHVAEFSAVACGRTRSCGCLAGEASVLSGKRNATHGMSKTVEFAAWGKMLARCSNPRDNSFKYYGARGISVCARWREKFENFFEDMGPRPSSEHSLDRINVNGNYEPSNCRWATKSEQARNTRDTPWITLEGTRVRLQDAIDASGITRETVKSRMSRGASAHEALTKPVRRIARTRRGTTISHKGVTDTIKGWSSRCGIPYKTLLYRLDHWDSLEDILTKPLQKPPSQ